MINVAVGRLHLSVSVAPTNAVEEIRSGPWGKDVERAFRAQKRRDALDLEKEQWTVRYRCLGAPRF
jgi:hypothetical protein